MTCDLGGKVEVEVLIRGFHVSLPISVSDVVESQLPTFSAIVTAFFFPEALPFPLPGWNMATWCLAEANIFPRKAVDGLSRCVAKRGLVTGAD